MHEAHVELLARHLERVPAVLGEGGAELQHVVVRLGHLEALLHSQISALAEVGRPHRVGDPVVLAVEVLQLPGRLVDVVLPDRADQLVHRAQQILGIERRGHERVEVREVGRAARGQRGEELGVEVAPAERLLAHLEARELPLELRDARVLDHLDGLRLDLGVPDLELAHLLADDRGRAAEGGRPDGGAGAGQEATTGDARRGCGGVGHRCRSFRGAFVGLRKVAGARRERSRVYSASRHLDNPDTAGAVLGPPTDRRAPAGGAQRGGCDEAALQAVDPDLDLDRSRGRRHRARGCGHLRGPGGRPDQDRLRHGPDRRALRERQAGLAGAADLEGRHQQEGRPARPAGGAGLLRRPDQPGHRAGHLLEAARRGQGGPRHLRLRHQPHRAAHADRHGAQAHDHGDLRPRQQREVQVPELLPDLAERPRAGDEHRARLLRAGGPAESEAADRRDRGCRRRVPAERPRGGARADQEVRLQDRLRQDLPAQHHRLHPDRAGDQGHQPRHRVRGLVPAGLGWHAARRARGGALSPSSSAAAWWA